MKLPRRNFLHLPAGAAALPAVSRIASAEAYPSRPVRVIVPFAPGGQTDVVARIIAQKLSAGKFHCEPPFTSFDHLVGAYEERFGDCQAQRLRRLKVDGQLKRFGCLKRQLARFGALQNLVHVGRGAPIHRANLNRKTSARPTARTP